MDNDLLLWALALVGWFVEEAQEPGHWLYMGILALVVAAICLMEHVATTAKQNKP